jgi:hypothetical protein
LKEDAVKEHADVTGSCLDAETMAAWADGGLSGETLQSVQAHVADCARCQALVGALARVEAAAPQIQAHRHGYFRLAWLVPLTAAAAGVALWVAVPRERSKPPAPSVVQPLSDALKDERQLEAAAPAIPKQNAAADVIPKQDSAAGNQPLVPARELRKEAAESLDAANAQAREAVPVGAPPAAAPVPTPAASRTVPATPSAPQNELQSARASARALGGDVAGRIAGAGGFARGMALVLSPDPSIRWRITGSVVERSTNGGAAWDPVPLPMTVDLTAGAAPSASVCWLVGRGGVVLLSTDGRSWRRLTFPEETDLSAVSATDARTASVTAADGRVFATTDGGAIWTRRPLQDF